MDFEEGHLVCNGVSVPMHEFPSNASEATLTEHLLQDCIDRNEENDEDRLSFDNDFAAEQLDSLCEAGDIRAIADLCAHLKTEQQEDLFELLSKFDVLFNDKLKTFTNDKIHLKVDPSLAPHCSHVCTVPHSHKAIFEKKLEQMTQESVMEKCGCATWVAGTFVAPKKDGQVRWVLDF